MLSIEAIANRGNRQHGANLADTLTEQKQQCSVTFGQPEEVKPAPTTFECEVISTPEVLANQALTFIYRAIDSGYSNEWEELELVENELALLGHRVWELPSEWLPLLGREYPNIDLLNAGIDRIVYEELEGVIKTIWSRLVDILASCNIYYVASIACRYGATFEPRSLDKLNEYKEYLPKIVAQESIKTFLEMLKLNKRELPINT